MRKLVSITVVAVLFAIGAYALNHRTEVFHPATSIPANQAPQPSTQGSEPLWTPTAAPNVQPLSDEERKILADAHQSLAVLALTSPRAKELLAFYDANAVPAHYLDEQRFQVVEAPHTGKFFFVVAVPGGDKHKSTDSFIAASYHRELRAMRISRLPSTKLVQGIFLAHEISHAEDHLVHGEPASPLFSPVWLRGEGNSHFTVFTILNEHTHGAWKRISVESGRKRMAAALAQGHSKYAFILGTSDVDSTLLVRTFGPLSPFDLQGLGTQLTVDANMMNIQEIAGRDTTMIVNGQMAFLKAFYRQAMQSVATTSH